MEIVITEASIRVTPEVYDEIFEGDYEGFVIIEDGDWVNDGKYQYKRVIVQHHESEKFFALYRGRTGSYFSDWYYDDVETEKDGMATLEEVYAHRITKVEYY